MSKRKQHAPEFKATRRDEQVQGPAFTVADGVQLGIHATLGATDQASTPPFFTPMLVAVRWAFR